MNQTSQNFISQNDVDPSIPGHITRAANRETTRQNVKNNLDPGTPYKRLARNVRLLKDYMKDVPTSAKDDYSTQQTIDNLHHLIQEIGRKPNICLVGSFDAGKSTLANALIGKDSIPTALTPMSAVPTYIRHLADRPTWMRDEVWMMDSTFNPFRWEDQKHCRQHLVKGGNLNILFEYGTHQGTATDQNKASYALVFLNAPILSACNLIDLPGFDNDDSDTERAKSHDLAPDIIVYLSPIVGFSRAGDFFRLAQFMRTMPSFEVIDDQFPTLGNLFLVASHVDPKRYNYQETDKVFKVTTERFWRTYETAITDRQVIIERKITQEEFRSRCFTFWYDQQNTQISLAGELITLLREQLPRIWYGRADQIIANFRDAAVQPYQARIDDYTARLEDLAKLEHKYNQYMVQEPERRKSAKQNRENVLSAIYEYSRDSIEELRRNYNRLTSSDSLESLIRRRYSDRKEAEEYAIGYILEKLQGELKDILTPKTKRLQEKTKVFLDHYKNAKQLSGYKVGAGIGFEEADVFVKGLAGVGAVGALTALGGGAIALSTTGTAAAIGTGIGYVGMGIVQALSVLTGPIGLAVIAG